MHPAPSLILFTVLSGLGLGLMATVGLGFGHGHTFGWVAGPVALVLTGVGGASSLGHLRRPSRAWRALSQWRSSWLSREGVLLIGASLLFVLYLALWLLLDLRFWLLGWIVAAIALVAVYSTAMIYGSIRAVPRWSGTPTPWLYLSLALSGGLMANALCAWFAGAPGPRWLVFWSLFVAAGVAIWWQTQAAGARRNLDGSTIETAIGLRGLGRARLFEPPHTGSNYLLREMAFQVGRKRAHTLRLIGGIAGFPLPILLVLLALAVGFWLLIPALILHLAGVAALRWLFFAEAEHVQALYYGYR